MIGSGVTTLRGVSGVSYVGSYLLGVGVCVPVPP